MWTVHNGHVYGRNTYVKTGKAKYPIRHPIQDLPNHFHVSYEGLGGGNGYEIKSAVAPLSIHKILIKRFLFPNVTFNDSPNGHNNNGGIHVSISRTDETNAQLRKVFSFLHSGMEKQLALALSERKLSTFNLFAKRRRVTQGMLDVGAYHQWYGHYNIINCENPDRFELRMFAAQKHLLLPALEMADSLFSLAKQVDKITTAKWMAFIGSKLKYKDIYNHATACLTNLQKQKVAA
jgi:hypothetical protein